MFGFLKNLFMSEIKSALFVYTILMIIILLAKPRFLFDEENKMKRFGLGNGKNTTIFPLWIVCIILAVLSYYFVVMMGMVKDKTNFSLFGSSNPENGMGNMPQVPQSTNYGGMMSNPIQNQVPQQPVQNVGMGYGSPQQGQYGGSNVQFVNPIQPRRF
jgi:hypothetical protein